MLQAGVSQAVQSALMCTNACETSGSNPLHSPIVVQQQQLEAAQLPQLLRQRRQVVVP